MGSGIMLTLDYGGVLSAWEKSGCGNVFFSDDMKYEDPSAITLDLSHWEASLNPPARLEPTTTSLFASVCGLFSPAELGLSTFLPSQSAPGQQGQGITSPHHQQQHGDAAWNSQVVPSCGPSASCDGSDSAVSCFDAAHIKLEAVAEPYGADQAVPTSSASSDAAVVPDAGASPHNNSNSSTATSSVSVGLVPQAPAQPAQPTQPQQPQQTQPQVPQPQPAAAPQAPAAAAAGLVVSSAVHGASKQAEEPVFVRSRAECLERYREKRARRLYTKKIRYQLRKINADKRPRIKGRFVKKEELEEYLRSQPDEGAAAAGDEDEDTCMAESDEE